MSVKLDPQSKNFAKSRQDEGRKLLEREFQTQEFKESSTRRDSAKNGTNSLPLISLKQSTIGDYSSRGNPFTRKRKESVPY